MRVKIFLIVFTLLCVVQSAKWDYWHQKICAQSPAIELDHDVFYSMKSDQGWVGNCIVFSTDNQSKQQINGTFKIKANGSLVQCGDIYYRVDDECTIATSYFDISITVGSFLSESGRFRYYQNMFRSNQVGQVSGSNKLQICQFPSLCYSNITEATYDSHIYLILGRNQKEYKDPTPNKKKQNLKEGPSQMWFV